MGKTETNFIKIWEENIGNFLSGLDVVDKKKHIARSVLEAKGLPTLKSETYRKTDICSLLGDKDWNIKQADDIYNEYYKEEKDKIFIGLFSEFASLYPSKAEKYYCDIDEEHNDAMIALNTMLAKNIFVIYVADETTIGEPIDINKCINAIQSDMIVDRILLIFGNGSKANVLFNNQVGSDNRNEIMLFSVMEVFAEDFSDINITSIENTTPEFCNLSSNVVSVGKGAKLSLNIFSLSNGITRNNFYCNLEDESSALHLNGLVLGFDKQHIDNYSFINHKVPNCKSDEIFKYILSDDSRGIFTGKIYVSKDSQKTEAYQNNKNFLLSDNAKMFSRPQLEIYADDVKCSHGMTTGQIDSNAVFYMRQRGIPYNEAKRLLIIAFADDVINKVVVENWQNLIKELVDEKFRCN